MGEQTAFAREIVEFFEVYGEAKIRDIRDTPHSGYRAVHVWLRLPAGRVEVQIRTRGQSAWANTYERLGDLAGRQIRYGEAHEDLGVRRMVQLMHGLADKLRNAELVRQQSDALAVDMAELDRKIDVSRAEQEEAGRTDSSMEMLSKLKGIQAEHHERLAGLRSRAQSQLDHYIETLNQLERSLDEAEWPEAGETSAEIRD